MAQAGFFRRYGTRVPRSLLQMTAASLATFLATAVWYDLPHHSGAPAQLRQPEKLSLQAPPLSLRIREPSAEDEASRFMEAVALSQVAPLRPEGDIDSPPVELTTPLAVQQAQAHAPQQKPRLVVAAVPLPPRQPAPRVIPASVTPQAVPATPSGLRPPADIPKASTQPSEHSGRPSVVSNLARSTQKTLSDGLDGLSRSVGSLLR